MAINTLAFNRPDGTEFFARLSRTVAAGYTGRDRQMIQAHIDELAAQGIAPPANVPMLFPVLPTLVTNAAEIAVVGDNTTPEIEVAVFRADGTDYVTVASDQTDRIWEAVSITMSKNICPKVVGTTAWPVTDVADHWDQLQLTASCGDTSLQHGNLSLMQPLGDILAFVDRIDGPEREGRLVLSGTIPTDHQPPKGETTIELRLHDPVLQRTIEHRYRLTCLPDYFG